jgi:hypothetical protein
MRRLSGNTVNRTAAAIIKPIPSRASMTFPAQHRAKLH